MPEIRSEEGSEEILLDVNALAEGRDYTRVGVFENSPNHEMVAYGVDFDGSEQYTIQVVDLATGETLPDTIPNTYYSLEWANDNRTFYYSVLDEHHRRSASTGIRWEKIRVTTRWSITKMIRVFRRMRQIEQWTVHLRRGGRQ